MGQAICRGFGYTREVDRSFRRIALSINRIVRQVDFPNDAHAIIQIFRCAMGGQVTRIRVQVDRIGLNARRRNTFFSLTTVRFLGGFRTLFSEAIPMETFRAQLNEDAFLLYGRFQALFISVYFSLLGRTSDRIPWLLRMIKDMMFISPLMT